jgi:SAM-dependent methyltransferase
MATPLQQILGSAGGDGWEQSWQRGVTPWDAGCAAPSLTGLVASGTLPPGRALVPGVGGGYDALALASPTRSVIGLDLSATAVDVANARRDALGIPAASCAFVAGDFFSSEQGQFDLIWDYTFFCALQPELRPRWAARMRQLLSPGGVLVTLIFPIGDFAGGPPFAVSPELYSRVLGDAGFEAVALAPVPAALSHAARVGKEWLGTWRVKAGASAAL